MLFLSSVAVKTIHHQIIIFKYSFNIYEMYDYKSVVQNQKIEKNHILSIYQDIKLIYYKHNFTLEL